MAWLYEGDAATLIGLGILAAGIGLVLAIRELRRQLRRRTQD